MFNFGKTNTLPSKVELNHFGREQVRRVDDRRKRWEDNERRRQEEERRRFERRQGGMHGQPHVVHGQPHSVVATVNPYAQHQAKLALGNPDDPYSPAAAKRRAEREVVERMEYELGLKMLEAENKALRANWDNVNPFGMQNMMPMRNPYVMFRGQAQLQTPVQDGGHQTMPMYGTNRPAPGLPPPPTISQAAPGPSGPRRNPTTRRESEQDWSEFQE